MSHMCTTHAPYTVPNSSFCERCKANSQRLLQSELQHVLDIWCFVKLFVFQKEKKWALVSFSTQNGSLFKFWESFFSGNRDKFRASKVLAERVLAHKNIQVLCDSNVWGGVHETFVCVYVCMCIYRFVYIFTFLHFHYTCAYVYLQVCTYIYVCAFPFRSIVLVERAVAHKNIEVLCDSIVGCTFYLYIYCCRYTYVYVYIYICSYVYMWIRVCIYYSYIYVHVYMCVCIYSHKYTCIHAYHVYWYVCKHVYHVCIFTYAYLLYVNMYIIYAYLHVYMQICSEYTYLQSFIDKGCGCVHLRGWLQYTYAGSIHE